MIGIAVYFALGAACGMGIGSAGLLVTYLVIAKGMNQSDARLVNLIFFICSGLRRLRSTSAGEKWIKRCFSA